MDKALTWTRLVELLAEHHASPRAHLSRDPLDLVLWEQVAYLARDPVRAAAFKELKRRTANDPARILALHLKELQAITRSGGSIGWKERAARIRTSAELAPTLKDLKKVSLAEARKRLRAFPMIGAPGADRILLHAGLFPVFALESNGLRVLLRLGAAKEGRDYAASYRAVIAAMSPLLPDDVGALAQGESLLRAHGVSICTRSTPKCGSCSLLPYCPTGRTLVR